MIISELPAFLDNLGGESYKGLIIALFTFTAGISRPFSGKLADEISRKKAILIGVFVCFIASIFYPFSQSIFFFLVLRFFHGFSTGFNPTGVSSYMADIVPANRRGEAMGYLGFFCSIGMAAGPLLGSYLAQNYSLNTMFYMASVSSLITLLMSLAIPENKNQEDAPSWKIIFKVSLEDFWEKRILPVAILMLLTEYTFGVVLTVIPDYTTLLGFENKSIFFSLFVLSSVIVRVLTGKLSDRIGRPPVLKIALLICILASIVLIFGETQFWFLASSVILGFGLGMASPTLFAWTIDLANPKKIGRAFATLYISLELGIGIGALISGTLLSKITNPYFWIFFSGCLAFLMAFIYLFFQQKPRKENR
jgi:MFS family permease